MLNIHLKGLRFPMRSPQHSIRRIEFDHWLLERSGAEVRQHNVQHVEPDGDGYRIDGEFRCRYLIGAGGTRCPVYRDLFRTAQPRPKELQVVALELEFPFDWRDPDFAYAPESRVLPSVRQSCTDESTFTPVGELLVG